MFDKEIKHFSNQYSDLVNTMDRASSHRKAIQTAVQRGRTLARFKIAVLNKDDPNFVAEWDKATQMCEQTLISTLINHLTRIETCSNHTIREAAKSCYNTLKGIYPDRAKDALEDILKGSERECQQRLETRKRKS